MELRPRPAVPKTVAGYIRWSTDEQSQGTTLEVQQEAIYHFMKSQGWVYRPELVFVDDGYSGANTDRPGLTRLREAVRAGTVQVVVVYKLDRLSRKLLDCVRLVMDEWAGKCMLYSARENLDTSSPTGRLVFNILASFAELERDVIRDRTLSGKYKIASKGKNAGHRFPYGYAADDRGQWVIDRWDEKLGFTGPAAVVRRIFESYLMGMGAPAIAELLRKEGVPTRYGGVWRFTQVYQMLNNPAYVGTYAYGKRPGVRSWLNQAPKCLVPGAFPGIVSGAEWERAQAIMRMRSEKSPRALAGDYLLSGIATCTRCGTTLIGSSSGSPRGGKYRYYVCNKKAQLGACASARIPADDLEQAVLQEIRRAFSSDSFPDQSDAVHADINLGIQQLKYVADQAEGSLTEIRRKEQKLTEDYYIGKLIPETYERLWAALAGDKDSTERRLAAARAKLATQESKTVAVELLPDAAAKVELWDELTVSETKQLLGDAIGRLAVFQATKPGGQRQNPNPIEVELALHCGQFHS